MMTKFFYCPHCKRHSEYPPNYRTLQGITIGPLCDLCWDDKGPQLDQFLEARKS